VLYRLMKRLNKSARRVGDQSLVIKSDFSFAVAIYWILSENWTVDPYYNSTFQND